ncbi:MAG TPA: ScyD/ScyE family protein [Gemmatimonadales bacterium]|nr:ScyD/ScyE family protein [Gemmatimonadales bacterium]
MPVPSRAASAAPSLRTLSALALVTLVASCGSSTDEPLAPSTPSSAAPSDAAGASALALVQPEVFATGLKFPRGFTWGPDGALYVAEAGTGGPKTTTPEQCEQVAPPVGPYSNGSNARISKIDHEGHRTTFAGGFPSAADQIDGTLGLADVAFIGDRLYALLTGAGCSHGIRRFPNGIARVESNGEWSIVANLSAYTRAHPVANPGPDFEPDGSYFSMLALNDRLFAVDANHGEVVRINPATGRICRVVDVSASQGHIVPTALADRNGVIFLGNLGTFPIDPHSEKILRVGRDGALSVEARFFTTVLGLDFDAEGRMYVLESSKAAGFPAPDEGRVVRLNRDGTRDIIVNKLDFPTSMRFGPDGRLYISNHGYGPGGLGEILRVEVPGPGGAVATR